MISSAYSAQRTVLYLRSDHCAPCKKVGPIIEKLTFQYKIPLKKVDVEHDGKTPQQYRVRGIPTLILLENGRELRRISGGVSEQKIKEWLFGDG